MTYPNATFVACLTVALCGLSQIAAGATLCVSKTPYPGCPYSTIGAAVPSCRPIPGNHATEIDFA